MSADVRGRPVRRLRWTILAGAALFAAGVVVAVRSGVVHLRSEPVEFRSGDVTLSGRLVLPRFGSGPLPAAVIVHGSGRTGWRDLKPYARYLVPQGMAVLLYDKRGVGNSGGVYQRIGVADSAVSLGELAEDAAAAVAFLRGRADVDPERIGLLGGSQAGWIMPLAVSHGARVAWIVAISGPAVSYGEEIHYSRLTGDDPGGPATALDDAEIARRLAAYEGPHGYDPLPVLQTLRIPSLWVIGGSDRSVPMAMTVANLEALRDRPGVPVTIQLHPTGDHSLIDAETGRRIDYRPDVVTWLRERGMTGR